MNTKWSTIGWGAVALICSSFLSTVQAQTPKLSDPEIASVAVTANQVDIDYAGIALKKSHSADIRNFAQTMQRDHQSVINQAVALVKKLHVTPQDNTVSQSLKKQEAQTAKMLKSKTGRAFDQAYIENEVNYHQAVIQTVKDVLIPQAQNGELKSLLEKVLPILQEHLQHAENIANQFRS
ncbi:MAG: DUF4142 domain-containing protein [Thermoflavifilum sp.]|nr:DUF4142 domain-containing protein [Thermoflavifilum sp.]